MIYAIVLISCLTTAAPQVVSTVTVPSPPFLFMMDDTTIAAFDVPPKLKVQSPVDYPESAKQDKLQGNVVLMMTISEDGTVFSVKVEKSVRKDLDDAAVKSARTWSFVPAHKDGKPVKSVVAVPVRFKLDDSAPSNTGMKAEEPSPKPGKRVPPTYPKEAVEKKIEGTVHVEIIVDEEGKVIEAKVLKSAHPLLDKAALESVRQWTFEPTGEARTSLVAPVRFKLSDDK